MGWRSKKKKEKQAAAAEQDSEKQVSMSSAKRKKESVIFESVVENSMNSFRKNKLFAVKRDDEDLYVGAYMLFSAIGGLSVADKSDESKGSIINLINNGKIGILFTKLLEEEEAIIFIPNKESLDVMNEYTLLADTATYELVFVNPEGDDIEHTGIQVSLAQLLRLHATGKSVSTFPGMAALLEDVEVEGEEVLESIEDDHAPEGFDDRPEDDPEDEPEDDEQPVDDDDPSLLESSADEDLPDEDEEGDGEEDDEMPFDGDVEGYGSSEDEPGSEEEGESEPEPDVEVHYDSDMTARALARRFFNEDLTRELNTAGLDQMLGSMAAFQPLEKRPEGWLDSQVNVMLDLANQELFALHQQNLSLVRQKYLEIMAEAYESEMGAVTEIEKDPRYKILQEARQAEYETVPGRIKEQQEALQRAYEERVHEAGEKARQSAESTYAQRFRWQHEEQVKNVGLDMETGLEASFERAVSELKSVRKREADVKLDALDSETIRKCYEEYMDLAKSEVELLERHKANILNFIEEHRAADIAHIEVLREEQGRLDKVQQSETEYQARIQSMRDEFDTRVLGMNHDMEQMRERYEASLVQKDAECVEQINKYKAESEQQQARIERMMGEFTSLDERTQARFRTQIEELTVQRDSANMKYDALVQTQKKGNKLMVALCLVACIAALVVGILVGQQMGRTQQKQEDIVNTVYDQMVGTNQGPSGNGGE